MKKKNFLKMHLAMLLFFFVAVSGLTAQDASSVVDYSATGNADFQAAQTILNNNNQAYKGTQDAIMALKTEAIAVVSAANGQKEEEQKAKVRADYYVHVMQQLMAGAPLSDRVMLSTYPFLLDKFDGMDPIPGFTAEGVFTETVELVKQ